MKPTMIEKVMEQDRAIKKLKSLNAELLEALEILTDVVERNWDKSNRYPERWVNKANETIQKAKQ